MNIHLSNFLAEILEPIGGEMEGRAEKGSTENVLYEVDRYKEEIERSEVTALCEEIIDELAIGIVSPQGECKDKEETGIYSTSGERSPQERDMSRSKED